MDPVSPAAPACTAGRSPSRQRLPARAFDLGRQAYEPVWRAMQRFTDARDQDTLDELWLVEHEPVFTLGQAGKPEHVLAPGEIPVLHVDRGGQVTYHGPGQVVAYPLIDLKARSYFVKEYVHRLEEAVIRTLAHFGVTGHRVAGAPGIYVRLDDPFSYAVLPQRPQRREPGSPAPQPDFSGLGKIAALGIKVSNHRTYHGVALNVAMDLQPYQRINPCGYAGLQTVDLSTIGVSATWDEAAQQLAAQLTRLLAV